MSAKFLLIHNKSTLHLTFISQSCKQTNKQNKPLTWTPLPSAWLYDIVGEIRAHDAADSDVAREKADLRAGVDHASAQRLT